jgi:hypothetical protein
LDPSNYVKNDNGNAGDKPGIGRKGSVEKFAQVLHTMKAQLPEEIDLTEGDVVKIVEIIDKDWYR